MKALVPARVTNFTCTAPCPASPAPCVAVVTETSSTESRRGLTIAKKPSVDRSVLSWMFTPSSVMLIMPRGRPLIVASRLPAGVDTPGRKLTKSIALRDVNGSFVICVLVTVDDTVGDVVCTISDDDVTVTCSVSPPTSRVARTLAGEPAVTTTLLTTTVLNPCSATVTVYEPDTMLGNENDPSELVMDSCATPVALCLMATFAPGTTPPVLSVTMPEMVEVTPPCPKAEVARISERSRVETAAKDRRATRVALDQDDFVPA